MTRHAARPPSQRQLRVGEEIRHSLAELLQRGDFHDPALEGSNVTVTEVRISPDLKNATAFVMPLGGADVTGVVAALNHAAPFVRSHLAGTLRLKSVPRVSFSADRSFDTARRIDTLLRSPTVARDLDAPGEEETNDGT